MLNTEAQNKKDEMMNIFQKVMKKNGGKIDVYYLILMFKERNSLPRNIKD
jgi:hypothetical protein